jgi:CheY-like chemotaxis protein
LSGKTAVELVRHAKTQYDLIIMDHMRPEVSGVDAVRIIRREIDSDYARNVPIVVFTANTIADNREGFILNGFSGYLAKPVDVYELDDVLNDFLDDNHAEEALEEIFEDGAKPALNSPESVVNSTETPVDKNGADNAAALPDEEKSAEVLEELLPSDEDAVADAVAVAVADESDEAELSKHIELDLINKVTPLLPEIDIAKTLKNYGLPTIVLSTLYRFAKELPAMLAELEDPAAMEMDAYRIKVHGLKGAIRGIYDESDGALAAELESFAKNNDLEAILKKNGAFIARMTAVVDTLKTVLAESADENKEKKHAARPDETLLFSLKDAASRFSSYEMEEYLSELEEYAYDEDGELVEWLRNAVDNLEYGEIVEKLK